MRMKPWFACVFLGILGACEPNSGPPPPTHPWVNAFPAPLCIDSEAPWTCVRLMQGPLGSQPDAGENPTSLDGGCVIQPVVVCCPLTNNNSSYAQYLAKRAYEDAPAFDADYTVVNILCHAGSDVGVTKTPGAARTAGGHVHAVTSPEDEYPVCPAIEPTGAGGAGGAGGGPAVSCGGDLASCVNDSDCCSGICSLNACGGQPGQNFDAGGGAGGAP